MFIFIIVTIAAGALILASAAALQIPRVLALLNGEIDQFIKTRLIGK